MKDLMFCDFNVHYPYYAKRVVDYWEYCTYELAVKMDDGIVLIYDGIMKLVSMFIFKGKVNRFKKKLNEDVIIIDKDENDSQNGENK